MPEDFRDIQEGLSNYVKIGSTIFLSLAGLFIIFILVSIQRRKKLLEKQKEMQYNFNQALLQTQIEIQEQTLKTISQEIHDNVGQVLSLAKLNLNTLHMNGGIEKDKKIDSSISLIGKAISDLRQLSKSINGDKIGDMGLIDAVENEMLIIGNTGQFNTSMLITGERYKLQPQQEMVIFRIVQESLNNAVKHSQAVNIKCIITFRTQQFNLTIEDDGKGFDADSLEASKTGIGLSNIKDRASLIGARFSVLAQPDCGTKVTIELPIEKNQNHV